MMAFSGVRNSWLIRDRKRDNPLEARGLNRQQPVHRWRRPQYDFAGSPEHGLQRRPGRQATAFAERAATGCEDLEDTLLIAQPEHLRRTQMTGQRFDHGGAWLGLCPAKPLGTHFQTAEGTAEGGLLAKAVTQRRYQSGFGHRKPYPRAPSRAR